MYWIRAWMTVRQNLTLLKDKELPSIWRTWEEGGRKVEGLSPEMKNLFRETCWDGVVILKTWQAHEEKWDLCDWQSMWTWQTKHKWTSVSVWAAVMKQTCLRHSWHSKRGGPVKTSFLIHKNQEWKWTTPVLTQTLSWPSYLHRWNHLDVVVSNLSIRWWIVSKQVAQPPLLRQGLICPGTWHVSYPIPPHSTLCF